VQEDWERTESRLLYTATDGCQRHNLASLNVFPGAVFRSAKLHRQVWFNFSGFIVVMSLGTWRALRWRAGCEATISTLKHPFSMLRASYKTDPGFQRYVGWCVITKNLFSIARYQERRRINGQVD